MKDKFSSSSDSKDNSNENISLVKEFFTSYHTSKNPLVKRKPSISDEKELNTLTDLTIQPRSEELKMKKKLTVEKEKKKESKLIKGLTEEDVDPLDCELEKLFNPSADFESPESTPDLPQSDSNETLQKLEALIFKDYNDKETLKISTHYTIKGHYTNLIHTHSGSRLLQKVLNPKIQDLLADLFDEIKDNLLRLMTQNYSNYFCQIFYTNLNEKNRLHFLSFLKRDILKISKNRIGTFAIQGIINVMESQNEKISLVNCFEEMPNDQFKQICIVRPLT